MVSSSLLGQSHLFSRNDQTLWMLCLVLATTAAKDAATDWHVTSGKAKSRHPKEWSSARETTGLAPPLPLDTFPRAMQWL